METLKELLRYEPVSLSPSPKGRWFYTYTRRKFSFSNTTVESIDIRDIAHALSSKNRFCGHLRGFYSVAQHSVLVSYLVPQEYALWALLHDSTEAYVADLPSPLKSLVPGFKKIENRIMKVIAKKFGIEPVEPPIVKHWDSRILATEILQFFGEEALREAQEQGFPKEDPIPNYTIEKWSIKKSEREFLKRFISLYANQLTQQAQASAS